MAYLGRYRLGQYVPLKCQCLDANGTPTTPTTPVQAVIWKPDNTKLVAFEMPILDRYVPVTALFSYLLRLSEVYATLGTYQVVYYYGISTFSGMEEDVFQVVEGGDADGNIVAAYAYSQPHGEYLVYQLDSGKIRQGRNPKVQ